MSPFKRLFPMALGLSLALVALSAAPSANAGTSTVSLALTAGNLTASLANVSLTGLTYSHSDQHQTGSMTLTADDSTGSGLGWNVTVQSSPIVYSGANGGTDIPAVNLVITAANTPTATAGQAVDPTDGPLAGTASSLDAARRVIYANAGFGQGGYSQTLPIDLLVPGMARAGTYTGTLTVTVTAGPGV